MALRFVSGVRGGCRRNPCPAGQFLMGASCLLQRGMAGTPPGRRQGDLPRLKFFGGVPPPTRMRGRRGVPPPFPSAGFRPLTQMRERGNSGASRRIIQRKRGYLALEICSLLMFGLGGRGYHPPSQKFSVGGPPPTLHGGRWGYLPCLTGTG